MSWLKLCFRVSTHRACRLIRFRSASFRYKSKRPEQAYLIKRIRELAAEKPRYGYKRIAILLRREGWKVNVKRV